MTINEVIIHLSQDEILEAQIAIECSIENIQDEITGLDIQEVKTAITHLQKIESLLSYAIIANEIQSMCNIIESFYQQEKITIHCIRRLEAANIDLKRATILFEKIENLHKEGRKIQGIENLSNHKIMITNSRKRLNEIFQREEYQKYKHLTKKELNRLMYKEIQEKRKDTPPSKGVLNNVNNDNVK